MGNKRSLTYLVWKYAALELAYTFGVIILFFAGLSLLAFNGIIYPANYASSHSAVIEKEFNQGFLNVSDIPFYYDYLYMENGRVIQDTIGDNYKAEVEMAIKTGSSATNTIIGAKYFKAYTKGGKTLVIKYRVSAIFAIEGLYKLVNNFESLYILITLFIWMVGFVLLIIRLSKLLRREIKKIASANENIKKMDLDYTRESSKYREIDGVLTSIDVLANNLKVSLNRQWDIQNAQKELIDSVVHDIRTPITLIKGNFELLQEENPDLSSERFADITNGMARLEGYIRKLTNFSYLIEGKKDTVSESVIDYWIDVISAICRANEFNVNIVQRNSSEVKLDKEAIAVALQNIVNNSVEHSTKGSDISVAFNDTVTQFEIVIRDEGNGFDESLIPVLTEKFISSKETDETSKHGIGLSIVKRIVTANDGDLYLKNYSDIKSGAEVKMVFRKNLS
jgi:hypothetical protein CLOSPO_03347